MKHLNNPTRYTEDERSDVRNLLASGLTAKQMWEKGRLKFLRHKICIHMLHEQQCRCAYCERILSKGDVTIDHIAPKTEHRRFTYEPLNLVVSCKACNSPTLKASKETIDGKENPYYPLNAFKIVHPFLDEPDQHIFFQDSERTILDMPRCTKQGKATIEMFDWDNLTAQQDRVNIVNSKILPETVAQRIADIAIYK